MNKKKLLSFITSAVMAAGFLSTMPQTEIFEPLTAEAENYSYEAKYGDHLYYKKVDEDEDGTYDYVRISDCDRSATSVEIPSEID
ncbi:MAG: hypothetical protein IJ365_07405 [Clostridia bacterium]|nr:hypothetical protein [Clostridia bacterium]